MIIDKYKAAAAFLEKDGDIALFDTFSQRMEKKEFYLPFIGQFSAGKSKLLNRIIGREILPTKSIETTAFLTYIKYGNEEKAELCYLDGTKETISFDNIKRLDYTNTKESEPIDCLNIYLNLDVLKSGLILVDTPGVNTLITEHVRMTTELLEQSQYVVYVMGSPLNSSDMTMLKKISNSGIPVVFTRTHIDLINPEEENVFDALEKEQKSIENLLDTDILFFSISNDPKSNMYNYRDYEMLYDFLTKQISNNVEVIYINSILNRLELFGVGYEKDLIARKQLILDSHSKTSEEIQNQINEIRKIQSEIEGGLSDKLRRIKDKGQEAYSVIDRTAIQLINENISTFERMVAQETTDKVRNLFVSNLSSSMDSLTRSVNESLEKWVENSISDVKQEYESINVELNNIDLSFDTSFTANMVSDYEEKENSLLEDFQEKYAQIQELKQKNDEELATLGLKKEDLAEAMSQYDEFVNQHNQEIDALQKSYEPQYIKQGGNLGNKMRKIGQVLDVATLLIPVAGWEKLGTMCAAKAAQLAEKGGKLASLASSAIGKIGKSADLMAKADTVLDSTKVIGEGIKAYQNGKFATYSAQMVEELAKKKKDTGFFDLFNISFWMGKVGDMIDPETYTLDTQYEEEYKNVVNQKKFELQAVIQKQLKMRKMMGEIQTAEDEIRIRTQIEKSEQEHLQTELQKMRADLEKRKKSDIDKSIREQSVIQFGEKLKYYSNELLKKVNGQIDLISSSIISSASENASMQLSSLEEQLQTILKNKDNVENALNETVVRIDEILDSLKVS